MRRFTTAAIVLSSILALPSVAGAELIHLRGVERTEPVALNESGAKILEGGAISRGAQMLQSFELMRGGKMVGEAALIDTAYKPGAFVVDMTVRLGEATLSGHGVSLVRERESTPTTVAITGGTGRYRDAEGIATLAETSESRGTLRLDLD